MILNLEKRLPNNTIQTLLNSNIINSTIIIHKRINQIPLLCCKFKRENILPILHKIREGEQCTTNTLYKYARFALYVYKHQSCSPQAEDRQVLFTYNQQKAEFFTRITSNNLNFLDRITYCKTHVVLHLH